jgi:Kef-type K+ transport system membrane component KefB
MPESGHDIQHLLLQILVIFVAAKLGAELFEWLQQPAVVGEILAGVIVGPQVLGWARPDEATFALAELGVLFLLFTVGLETNPSELARVGKAAIVVAVGGVALPFVLGYGLMMSLGSGQAVSLFIGAAMVATSVGITARVLAREGWLHLPASRIILGAAILDDILGLLILAVVSGFARGGVNLREIGVTTVTAVGFTALMLLYGRPLMRRTAPVLENLRTDQSLFLGSIALCLGLAVVSGYMGVAAIIGAFLAGVALSEVSEHTEYLPNRVAGLTEFFVPFFLAGIGMQLDLTSLTRPSVLALCLVLTLLAVVGKLLGCGLPLWRNDRRRATQVGIGMVPRGEVGIVVAQIGVSLGVLTQDLFAVVLFMAVATTMLAPPFLTRAFAGSERHVEETPDEVCTPDDLESRPVG